MAIKLIDDKALWDRFVDESPNGSIYHKWDALRTVEKYSGYQLRPYGIYRGAELICLDPVFFRQYKGMKLVLTPPPNTSYPYLGPVMSPTFFELKQKRKESYIEEIADELHKELSRLSPNFVTLSMGPCFEDIRPFTWFGYHADVTYDYVIDLAKPVEEVWGGFDSACKKIINKGAKMGMRMERSTDTKTFYKIMSDKFQEKNYPTMYDHGDPAYLKEFLDSYPENFMMYFLYNGEEVDGVHVVSEWKGKASLWLGSASGCHNEYMLWELIKLEKSRGMKKFEIPDANTRRLLPFKSKFNPSLEIGFKLSKKDPLGAIGEWAFVNLVKGWV